MEIRVQDFVVREYAIELLSLGPVLGGASRLHATIKTALEIETPITSPKVYHPFASSTASTRSEVVAGR